MQPHVQQFLSTYSRIRMPESEVLLKAALLSKMALLE